jgi:hypothetical protein
MRVGTGMVAMDIDIEKIQIAIVIGLVAYTAYPWLRNLMPKQADDGAPRFKLSYPPPPRNLLLDVVLSHRHELLDLAAAEGKLFRLEFVSSSESGNNVRVRLIPEGDE